MKHRRQGTKYNMPTLTLLWPEKNSRKAVHIPSGKVDFLKNYKHQNRIEYVAEFDPPFICKSTEIRHILFDNFIVKSEIIKFFLKDFKMKFELTVNTKMTIRTMHHSDILPKALNPVKNEGCVVIFVFLDEGLNIKFLNSFQCSKEFIFINLDNFAIAAGLSQNSYQYRIVNCSDFQYMFPSEDLIRSQQFRMFNTIIVNSLVLPIFKVCGELYSVYTLAEIPLALLRWALKRCSGNNSASIRRLGVITANSGIPIDLIDSIPELRSVGISSDNFDRISLPFNAWKDKFDFVQKFYDLDLKSGMFNLNTFIYNDSSEASYRSHFWDNLLISLIKSGNEHLNCFIESEWKSRSMFGQKNERRIDLAVLSKMYGLPVLIVEIGKDKTPDDCQHKDFTKMLTLMCQSCIRICIAMREEKKDPKLVRVYGLWIGGTQIQFCVAYPIFSSNQSNTHTDISVCLSFPDHWRVDVCDEGRKQISLDCSLKCCSGDRISCDIIGKLSESKLDLRVLGLDSSSKISTKKVIILDDEDNKNEDEDDKNTNSYSTSDELMTKSNKFFDIKSISLLKIFLDCAINKIIEIEEQIPSQNIFLPFSSAPNSIIPSSRPSSIKSTPNGDRLSDQSVNQDQDQTEKLIQQQQPLSIFNTKSVYPRKLFEICKKKNNYEELLYQKMGKLSFVFPFLFDYQTEIDSDSDNEKDRMIIFKFEKMIPFLVNGDFGPLVRHNCEESLLLDALTFTLHILYELLLLHERLLFVHSDISPSNIMFSKMSGIWKLNDFNQSFPINKSSCTVRIAGTDEYICPVAIETGIFTPQSDIYSLGKVLLNTFFFKLWICFEDNDENLNEKTKKSIKEFHDLISEMTREKFEERISVRKALELSFNLFNRNLLKEEDFEIYGWNSIIPLIINELKTKSRDLDIPMMDIM